MGREAKEVENPENIEKVTRVGDGPCPDLRSRIQHEHEGRMTNPSDTVRVVIPLAIRRRNGRPKVMPPESVTEQQVRA